MERGKVRGGLVSGKHRVEVEGGFGSGCGTLRLPGPGGRRVPGSGSISSSEIGDQVSVFVRGYRLAAKDAGTDVGQADLCVEIEVRHRKEFLV